MEATIILPRHTVHNETTDALAAYIRDMNTCAKCGKPSKIYDKDGATPLCGRCGLIAHGWEPKDE